MNIKEILAKCDMCIDPSHLVGKPFSEWPAAALEPWWWQGWTSPGHVAGGQWHRARGLVMWEKRRVSPARPLWEHFTKIKLDPKQRIAYQFRGVRETMQDDVNPAHYILLSPTPKPKRKNRKHGTAIADVANLMELANYWPENVTDLLAKWPELNSYPKEDLDATIRQCAL